MCIRDRFSSRSSSGGNYQTTDYGIVGKGKETNEVRESIMNSPIAYTSANNIKDIIIKDAYSTTKGGLTRTFKDGVIPKVGMTVRNITINSPSSGLDFATGGSTGFFVADSDASPLFRESTVVVSVERNNDDLIVGLNNAPVSESVSHIKTGGTAINSSINNDNGRVATGFFQYPGETDTTGQTRRKRLKFSFSGDNLLIRDNLPLVQGAIYDPSLLKERTEQLISSATTDGIITFPFPSSAAGKTSNSDSDTIARLNLTSLQYDDSPLGCYVHNTFSYGQIVEYTTDATDFANDAAGSSYFDKDTKNIFIIDRIDAKENSIRLRNLPTIELSLIHI